MTMYFRIVKDSSFFWLPYVSLSLNKAYRWLVQAWSISVFVALTLLNFVYPGGQRNGLPPSKCKCR